MRSAVQERPALTGFADVPARLAVRPHIAIVTDTYPPEINGVAHTLGHLVSGLRARGDRVSLVRPRRSGEAPGPGDGDLVTVGGLGLPGFGPVRLGLPAGAGLAAAWRSRPPAVVYVATEGLLGWSAVRLAGRLGIPAVSGFHTNFDAYARHYRLGWLRRPVAAYLRTFHRRTAGTLVASPDLARTLQQAGFGQVRVMGRGVDTGLFDPARRSPTLRRRWGAAPDELVALYVGRLAPEKNLALAVEAYRAMQRSRPLARFVLVGDGPERAALQRAHPDLVFCGFQTGHDLATHYASADVFLFPSETETFGNVTLEAMASGLVVLAYRYAAAAAYIVSGQSGVLVPPGDARAFVAAAVALAEAPAALGAMRAGARDRVLGAAWPAVVEQFRDLLLEASSPRRGNEPPPVTRTSSRRTEGDHLL